MPKKLILAVLTSALLIASVSAGQTVSGIGNGTSLPATCSVNDAYVVAGVVYACKTTNTWSPYATIADLSGLGGGGAVQTSFLVGGGQVVWTSNYNFTVSAASYYIGGVAYTSASANVTLTAAHATLDRIDTIAVDTSGTVVVVEGTAASTPSEPDIDPGTQLKLGIVLVTHNTTQPSTAASTLVYAEDTGGPGEWVCSTFGSGFNCSSTTNPRSPSTKDIEGTTVAAAAWAQGQISAGSFDPSTRSLLVFYLRSKAAWSNNRGLQITLRSASVVVGNTVTINRTGSFGFDSTSTGAYQQVAIPLQQFAVPAGTTITQVRFTDFGGSIGFYLDDITFQGGASVITPPPAPLGAGYVTTIADPILTGERVLTGTSNQIVVTDNGATTGTVVLSTPQSIATTSSPTFVAVNLTPVSIGNSGTSFSVNWASGSVQYVTLTGNVTSVTFSNPTAGGRYLLYLLTGAGSFTVTGWDGKVKWPGGTAPTISTGASKVDLITFGYLTGTQDTYYGSFNQNY